MNARPELSTVRAMDDCLVDVPLLDPAAAREIILAGRRRKFVAMKPARWVRC